MEVVQYQIAPEDRTAFLAAMAECERVRRRTGATAWQLCEDVAHPESWAEIWTMESWADHLREEMRLTDDDLAVLAAARRLLRGGGAPASSRYLTVNPAG
jgi:hypothetical protein